VSKEPNVSEFKKKIEMKNLINLLIKSSMLSEFSNQSVAREANLVMNQENNYFREVKRGKFKL